MIITSMKLNISLKSAEYAYVCSFADDTQRTSIQTEDFLFNSYNLLNDS